KYFPIIVSSPSGGGKSCICREILKKNKDILYSTSYTTRTPRENEDDGKDYFFVSKSHFRKMRRNGDFLEWAKVHGHYYGTSRKVIENALSQEKFIILDIDTKGSKKFLKRMPEALSIFLFPPSMKVLEKRLRNRNTDDERTIQLRLRNARKELADAWFYDLFLINDEISIVVDKILQEVKNKSECICLN
ncbi:MAG: guanylate kinase, partial [Candidatus Cloacimonetes bacterium]|nr:guanylate kinase [Candidatus Cloacimonadota bacterium]